MILVPFIFSCFFFLSSFRFNISSYLQSIWIFILCKNNFYIDQWLHKKNKFKLLKEKKRNVTCIFDRLERNHGKNLAFSSKNKWVYSLRTKKKNSSICNGLFSFLSPFPYLFFLICLCFCVLLFPRSSCEMKKYDIVLAAAIFSGVSSINDYLWPFFSTVNCFVSLLLSLHFSFSYRFFDCVYYYLVDV